MKIIKQIVKIGNSLGIILDKKVSAGLKHGDFLEIEFNKIETPTITSVPIIKSYRCKTCSHERDIPFGEDIYCSACGTESLEELNGSGGETNECR